MFGLFPVFAMCSSLGHNFVHVYLILHIDLSVGYSSKMYEMLLVISRFDFVFHFSTVLGI